MTALGRLYLEDLETLSVRDFWEHYGHLNLQEIHAHLESNESTLTVFSTIFNYLEHTLNNRYEALRHSAFGDQYWDGAQWHYYTSEELVEVLVEDDRNYLITMANLGLEPRTLSLPSCLKARLDYKPLKITIANAIKRSRNETNYVPTDLQLSINLQ